jgi:hypothetical protein
MDPETQARRFEQQLQAFEKLHTQELQALEEKLIAYMRLHADEVRLLREQLDELRQALRTAAEAGAGPIESRPAQPAPPPEEVNS